jgi:hypothetical protein
MPRLRVAVFMFACCRAVDPAGEQSSRAGARDCSRLLSRQEGAELRIIGGTHSFDARRTTAHEAMRFIFETVRRPELVN